MKSNNPKKQSNKTKKQEHKKSNDVKTDETIENEVKTNSKTNSHDDEFISSELVTFAKNNIHRDDGISCIMKNISDKKIANEMEEGIYRFSMTYVVTNNYIKELIPSIYETKIWEILRAIELYPELYTDIKNGNIEPRSIAFMKPSQLCPKNWSQLLAKKHLNEEKENNLPTTNMYKCYKCGERKCTISMLQTRSIDEPMTIFIRCSVCYNTWTK